MPREEHTGFSVAKLLAELRGRNMILKEELPDISAFATEYKKAKRLPVYLHVFVGLAAFIAAACFIGMIGELGLLPTNYHAVTNLLPGVRSPIQLLDNTYFLWGILFLIGGVMLARIPVADASALKSSFLQQMSLCCVAAGKLLCVAGVGTEFHLEDDWNIPLSVLVVTAAVYPFYHSAADRFVSVLVLLASTFIVLIYTHLSGGMREVLVDVFFVAQVGTGAALFTSARLKHEHLPVAYALVFSICGEVLFFAARYKLVYWQRDMVTLNPIVMNLTLAAALVALIIWVAGGLNKFVSSRALLLAALGAVLLGVFSAPGILLVIILMVLGYSRYETVLVTLGALLLPAFFFFYYDNIDVSLLAKSGILTASGCVLLAGWAYMHFRGLDQEAA